MSWYVQSYGGETSCQISKSVGVSDGCFLEEKNRNSVPVRVDITLFSNYSSSDLVSRLSTSNSGITSTGLRKMSECRASIFLGNIANL